jgi:hypothetical protein
MFSAHIKRQGNTSTYFDAAGRLDLQARHLVSRHLASALAIALMICASCPLIANGQVTGQGQRVKVPAAKPAQKLTSAPANFPVPTYTRNVISTEFVQSNTRGAPSVTALTKTQDSPDLPFQWYRQTLTESGWEVTTPNARSITPAQTNGQLFMLRANKDNFGLMISCSRFPKAPYTTISVSAIQNVSPK